MKKVLLIIIFLLFTYKTNSVYYSQFQQDKFIYKTFFKNKKHGTFVDIGAYDGIKFSNTFFFEKELEWDGLCIEPIPQVFEILKTNRKCQCINGAIYNFNGKMDFFLVDSIAKKDSRIKMYSGLAAYLNKNKLNNKVNKHEKAYIKESEVDCYILNDLLEEYKIYKIDFLSIDTEGGEYEILKSIDYERFNIDVISVEFNKHYNEIIELLTQKGYRLTKKLMVDLIFKKNINI